MFKHCQVKTYSGWRLHERPLRFFWEDAWVEVEAVAQAWQEPGCYFFRVQTAQGPFILKYHRLREAWEARRVPEKEEVFSPPE